jgi:hypothetical protein
MGIPKSIGSFASAIGALVAAFAGVAIISADFSAATAGATAS